MEFIIAEFILDPEKDENTAGYSRSQAKDIDERITFMSFNVS